MSLWLQDFSKSSHKCRAQATSDRQGQEPGYYNVSEQFPVNACPRTEPAHKHDTPDFTVCRGDRNAEVRGQKDR